jgi:4-carboxymuconolactone decarboxylase
MAKSSARVPLIERTDLPPAEAAAYDHVAQSRGAARMPNVFKAIANNLPYWKRWPPSVNSCGFRPSSIPSCANWLFSPRRRSRDRSTNGRRTGAIAQKLGASAALLNMIGTPQIEREAAPAGIVLRFARLVARNENVDDATFEAVKSHLGNAGVVELIALVGYYGALARMLNVLGVPLDEGGRGKTLRRILVQLKD